jgi:hypothetical protein
MHSLRALLSLVTALGAFAIIVLFILFLRASPHEPSDQRMLDYYTQHQTEFDRLAAMLSTENELSLVYAESASCETVDRKPVLASESNKCNEYVHLFKALEIDWAYVDRAPVYLGVCTWGMTGHGLTKGYLFATDPSSLTGVMVDNTGTRGNQMPRYRKLDENWYIFFR